MATGRKDVSEGVFPLEAKFAEQEAPRIASCRPRVGGKFLFVDEKKLYVRGVTYGPFGPADDSTEYPTPEQAARDFQQMAACGINTIRTYTVPPPFLLDLAWDNGLRAMVGFPGEQQFSFLDDRDTPAEIERRVRARVRSCAGHPAILCYAIGNEIPANLVRWLGRHRVERFIERLYHAAKCEDPGGLFTYVNFPTTEFLDLPFLDLFCFNVYLESPSAFQAYLARLQNLVGNRPLLMAEIGLDSRRKGEEAQSRSLDWQIRSAFAGGCAGAFVFSWTDEWHRGGCQIDDWDFGLTRRDRTPKPALETVRRVFAEVPFSNRRWPRVSVVVCTYNDGGTLGDCFEHLQKLDYPNFEVIVVDDGSTDRYVDHATDYGFRLIRTANSGLSSARNTGMRAATGEIVAYIDADAYPDPDWLKYLAATFLEGGYAGVGGPNIPPPGDGWIADCVSNSPGGPIQVLLSDREAEHIPGCNMAFLRSALVEIGGFDERFRVAGDDVDVCWNVQKRGWRLGFSPAAVVWHHRRNSLRTYWKQQRGYGRAEALLEKKWPEKYNAAGHVSWGGQIYGNGFSTLLPRAGRVYQGPWGTAPFQRLYQPAPGVLTSLILMPEWYLIVLLLGVITVLGLTWRPLLLAAPLAIAALAAPVVHAVASAWRSQFATAPRSRLERFRLRAVTAFLHVLQPVARLVGRTNLGLTPMRCLRAARPRVPRPRQLALWSEKWQSQGDRLQALESTLQQRRVVVHRNGDFDSWDLHVRGGLFGSARLKMVVEEYGQSRQLVRMRVWPLWSGVGLGLIVLLSALCAGAGLERAWIACGTVGLMAVLITLGALHEGERALETVLDGTDLWMAALPSAIPLPARPRDKEQTSAELRRAPAAATTAAIPAPVAPRRTRGAREGRTS